MAQFDYFIVFAEMRTGSNFLEANLNALDGVTCHGEAFNPHFIGYPNQSDILGVTQEARDANPRDLLKAIRKDTGGFGGFRYFHDHDPRVLDQVMEDPKCAKIILTRNPVDSYVSWKIAKATGQWKLTDAKARKDGRAEFDADEFDLHLSRLQEFQVHLLNRLQTSGQTAFYIAYEDLQSLDVMNGLARFLGVEARLENLDRSLKKQNPSPISQKVRNFGAMQEALSRVDQFNLTRTPNFEPRRGAAVPTYVAATKVPLLYMPIKGGIETRVTAWLAAVDGVAEEQLQSQMRQTDLRAWMAERPGHRSFTVLRHPVARAHAAYCARILNTGPGSFTAIRNTLRKRYKLPLPETMPDLSYDKAAHRAAFSAFLDWLKSNLAGQTAIRIDAAWSSQAQVLQGFADFVLPDRVMREETLETELRDLAVLAGVTEIPVLPEGVEDAPVELSEIYDAEIERQVRAAYPRDYLLFGFGDWA